MKLYGNEIWKLVIVVIFIFYNTTISAQLLNIPGRGRVQWAQDKNNEDTCSPAYNKFCSTSNGDGCDCDRYPLGCAAVAMGQIMWRWQWPISYNWKIIPTRLGYNTSLNASDEVARLLKDCGHEADIDYNCWGSWTTVDETLAAFRTSFNYKSASREPRSNWNYGNAWEDLIRSELDAGRPVFYRGDKSDLSGEKHFFVIDGYDPADHSSFHINWGWGGNYDGYFHLDDLTPGDKEFNKNQMAIVGISPTYNSPTNVNITDVAYTSVSTTKNEEAKQNITLPLAGKTLTVISGGELNLTTGNSIILKPGFNAQYGSLTSAKINTALSTEMNISVVAWTNYLTPNGDGLNDNLSFLVENADSWEFMAFGINGSSVFQSAGVITNGRAVVWDGSGVSATGYYNCSIRFKNSYGRAISNSYLVYFQSGTKSASLNSNSFELIDAFGNITINHSLTADQKSDSLGIINSYDTLTSIDQTNIMDEKINVYPNPTNGIFSISTLNLLISELSIYNTIGQLIYKKSNINSNTYQIDLSGQSKGLYSAKIIVKDNVVVRKIVVN